MNQEIKEKWVAALRSGDYKQGVGVLHDAQNGEFCCLGVLCEIAAGEGATEATSVSNTGVVSYRANLGIDAVALLPDTVMEWAGFDTNSPSVPGGRLTEFNDRGATFTEIADLIEQHL